MKSFWINISITDCSSDCSREEESVSKRYSTSRIFQLEPVVPNIWAMNFVVHSNIWSWRITWLRGMIRWPRDLWIWRFSCFQEINQLSSVNCKNANFYVKFFSNPKSLEISQKLGFYVKMYVASIHYFILELRSWLDISTAEGLNRLLAPPAVFAKIRCVAS